MLFRDSRSRGVHADRDRLHRRDAPRLPRREAAVSARRGVSARRAATSSCPGSRRTCTRSSAARAAQGRSTTSPSRTTPSRAFERGVLRQLGWISASDRPPRGGGAAVETGSGQGDRRRNTGRRRTRRGAARSGASVIGVDRDPRALVAAATDAPGAASASRFQRAARATTAQRLEGELRSMGCCSTSACQLAAARRAVARLLVPERRPARHAHGQRGPDRRRADRALRRGRAGGRDLRATAKSASRSRSRRSLKAAQPQTTQEAVEAIKRAVPRRRGRRRSTWRPGPSRRCASR